MYVYSHEISFKCIYTYSIEPNILRIKLIRGRRDRSKKGGYAERRLSARESKLCAEPHRCGNLFLYVAGAAGTTYDVQNVPAAP